MPAEPDPVMSADALARADVDALRLQGHAGSLALALLAQLVVAVLVAWLLHPAVAVATVLGWLLVLALPVGMRLVLAHRQRQLGASGVPAAGSAARLLRQHRLLAGWLGLAWGLAAWLPATLDGTPMQATLSVALVGLAVGAMAVMLFDLGAALCFALPLLGALGWRLATVAGPLQPATLAACVLAGALVLLLALASRQVDRERRALAATQRAERHSARGAHDAQALLGQVFDHAGLGISVFDDQLRMVAWNQAVADLTGIGPALLRHGMPLADALRDLAVRGQVLPMAGSTDPLADVPARLHSLSQPVASVAHERWADGRLIETRRNPLPGGGFVMFLADITEREAGRRAAAEQQRMLALVLERTEQGFWYIDNDLRTTDANPAMCRMLGLSRSQLLGRSIHDFVDAENRAIFDKGVALRAAGQAGGYEVALTAADGRQVHCFNNATPVFDANGRKSGALGLFSDISAQKLAAQQVRQASDALADKSRVLALTFDSLVQGVLNVDADGHCTAWNARFLELLQFPPALMATRPHLRDLLEWQLAHGEFGDQLERMDDEGRASVTRAREGAPVPIGHRYRRTRADGTVLDVASHFAADGSLVRTFTDVTASVAAEAAVIAARDEAERAREEAETANRAKSDFLSRMSHELRTPLNAILGFAQLLQADADDPPSPGQRQRLDALVRGGNHLLALINDVLDVARIEAGNLQLRPEAVDLAQLARDALALVHPTAQARGVVLLPLALPPGDAAPAGGPWVLADATRLRQVLLNLLSNAIKFNRDAGEVRVRLRSDGASVCLEVADQGAGIAPDQQPRLFQAFERLDKDGAVEGTGIGLALSRSLVALMHGSIGVASTPGQGSVFWVRLPACAAPVHAPALQPPGPAQATTAPQRDVLYIEDNEVNQLLMQGMLAHRPGITLRLADLPETGLALAAAQPPHLVLLDIQLPGIDGFEVLRLLRQQPALRHTPVVAVSANAMPADLAQAREAGFADYLTKPLDMARLLAVVDRMLGPAQTPERASQVAQVG